MFLLPQTSRILFRSQIGASSFDLFSCRCLLVPVRSTYLAFVVLVPIRSTYLALVVLEYKCHDSCFQLTGYFAPL
jgi:hypothetical protein